MKTLVLAVGKDGLPYGVMYGQDVSLAQDKILKIPGSGQAALALAMYLVELKIWMTRRKGSVVGFKFQGKSGKSPVTSLGLQRNADSWLRDRFNNQHSLIFPSIQYPHGEAPGGRDRILGFEEEVPGGLEIVVLDISTGNPSKIEAVESLWELRERFFKQGDWPGDSQTYIDPPPVKGAIRKAGLVSDYSADDPQDMAASVGCRFVPTTEIDDISKRTIYGSREYGPDTGIIPSFEDYLGPGVLSRREEEAVLMHLENDGDCYVEGKRGSGKTTMAFQLAHRAKGSIANVFYLDIKDRSVGSVPDWERYLACRVIARPNQLLIVDNCHCRPEVLASILHARHLSKNYTPGGKPTYLLFLGRPEVNGNTVTSVAARFGFNSNVVRLTVSPDARDPLLKSILGRLLAKRKIAYDATKHRVTLHFDDADDDLLSLAILLQKKLNGRWPIKISANEFKQLWSNEK